jgi:regulator of protease activity HflC (stomatin/prohibitin superfamily)
MSIKTALLARTCEQWRVVVDAVEIKDLDIPEQMQRAIAREAEANRQFHAPAPNMLWVWMGGSSMTPRTGM